jgi:hypothetical protein
MGGTEENYEYFYYLVEPRSVKCVVIREVLTFLCFFCGQCSIENEITATKKNQQKNYKFPIVISHIIIILLLLLLLFHMEAG